MSNTKHTKGPWHTVETVVAQLNPEEKAYFIASEKNEVHGLLYGLKESDAQLIAAAPDLLEALEFLVKSFPELQTDEELSGADVIEHLANHWDIFIKAIAKAKGESNG